MFFLFRAGTCVGVNGKIEISKPPNLFLREEKRICVCSAINYLFSSLDGKNRNIRI